MFANREGVAGHHPRPVPPPRRAGARRAVRAAPPSRRAGDPTDSRVASPTPTAGPSRAPTSTSGRPTPRAATPASCPARPRATCAARSAPMPMAAMRCVTVIPGPYTIPLDGPTGKMTAAAGWSPWRPAHIHLIVSAEGHEPLVTQLFIDSSDYLDSDVASAVKPELIVHPTPKEDEPGVFQFEYDFALAPARTPAVAKTADRNRADARRSPHRRRGRRHRRADARHRAPRARDVPCNGLRAGTRAPRGRRRGGPVGQRDPPPPPASASARLPTPPSVEPSALVFRRWDERLASSPPTPWARATARTPRVRSAVLRRAPRRPASRSSLVGAAAGGAVEPGHRCIGRCRTTSNRRGPRRLEERPASVTADVVVGADGVHSAVRGVLVADRAPRPSTRAPSGIAAWSRSRRSPPCRT